MDVVELSWTNSFTHNNPTYMHLKISIWKLGSNIIESINVKVLSALHIFHAVKNENKNEIIIINTETY